MISFLEKTRQSFEFLIGKTPSMDLDPLPRTKALFAQSKFAIVRSPELDLLTANQVRTYEKPTEDCH
jgi:hypothetical protein